MIFWTRGTSARITNIPALHDASGFVQRFLRIQRGADREIEESDERVAVCKAILLHDKRKKHEFYPPLYTGATIMVVLRSRQCAVSRNDRIQTECFSVMNRAFLNRRLRFAHRRCPEPSVHS